MNTPNRILVADDVLADRVIIIRSLQEAGYEALEAGTGKEALEVARGQLPDLILLDIGMPGVDGIEACQTLKSLEETAEIPVIFITGMSDPRDIEEAFAVGGCDYVTKPVQTSEVRARVAVHLQLRKAQLELTESNAQLLRAQKLESIGQLAAGVAHEINTPTQFVGDNTRFLQESFSDLCELIRTLSGLSEPAGATPAVGEIIKEIQQALEQADVDYLQEQVPRALERSLHGLERISKIVKAMKEFSHPGSSDKEQADLNRAIESTITVARNEWRYVADLNLDLDPSLPTVPCVLGDFNQVILNLVVNAAHAIADVVGDGAEGKGTITIVTRQVEDWAEIRVADTGSGIPEQAREKVFDPFFTTKEVGKGTGQGLAIAHRVVTQGHSGSIQFKTEKGKGTTFVLRLPLESGSECVEAA